MAGLPIRLSLHKKHFVRESFALNCDLNVELASITELSGAGKEGCWVKTGTL